MHLQTQQQGKIGVVGQTIKIGKFYFSKNSLTMDSFEKKYFSRQNLLRISSFSEKDYEIFDKHHIQKM